MIYSYEPFEGTWRGSKRSFSNINPFIKEEKMTEFFLGVLVPVCVGLLVAVILLAKANKKKDEIIGGMGTRFSEIVDLIKNTPRNVINLSLNPVDIDAKLPPLELSIHPENFVVKVDELKKLLLNGLKTQKHNNPDTWAYCILEHAGVGAIIKSFTHLYKPLTLLLINKDMKGAKNYLEMLAESLCQAMAILPETTSEPQVS